MPAISQSLIRRAVIDMRVASPPGPSGPALDDQKVEPRSAALEAERQRKIAIGWLYLVDITSDDTLRAGYERIARHHMRLAQGVETRALTPGTPTEAFPP